jgi:heavy metal sensor kinase
VTVQNGSRPRFRRLRLETIRARLTLWYVVVLALTLAGYSAILVVSLSRGLENGVDRVLGDSARQAMGILQSATNEQELREDFRRINLGQWVSVYDASGERLIAGRTIPRPLDYKLAPIGPDPRFETISLPDGATWRVRLQQVKLPGQPERVLVAARAETFVQVAVGELLMLIGITAPLVLLLALGGGVFLASRALNPIDQITRTAEAIHAEDLHRRLGLRHTNDEVGRLAATFDHMLDRLDSAFERQRRFTSDASHELRTPLAMLVSRAGMALERPRSMGDYEEVLRAVRDEGLHMGRIVNDLLMLARGDAGDALAVAEPLDAAELIGSVAETMAPIADQRGIRLRIVTEGGTAVLGDQTRLTQLVVNLVDNALAHTPEGGSVELRASREKGHVVLHVADTGSGIAPEDLPHVFQRFFRAQPDRGRNRGGAGLGLALCQSIAQAHGGEIHVESEPGQGTRVTVRLPVSEPPAAEAPAPTPAPAAVATAP